jgi:UDP-N-acetyl-D-mannosaminuronate dehydrogenase
VILGLTFKENCPDIRNSKVKDIIKELQQYGVEPLVCDPWADPEAARREYGVTLTPLEAVKDADCIIAAVAHNEFKALDVEALNKMYKPGGEKILIDVKGIYDSKALTDAGFRIWRL